MLLSGSKTWSLVTEDVPRLVSADSVIIWSWICCVYLKDCISMTDALLKEPKLSRHIRLNHRIIALLSPEATQKYRKFTDHWTKLVISLSLPSSLFTTACASFGFIAAEFFQCFKRRKWSFVIYIVSFFWFENGFLQVKSS